MPDENMREMQSQMSRAVIETRRELKRIERAIAKMTNAERIDWGNVGDMKHVVEQLKQVADWEK